MRASKFTNSILRFADERRTLERCAVALLGQHGWELLLSYGRVMSGPRSGVYVSALPTNEILEILETLARGVEVDIHLMHRHVSGSYLSSMLRLEGGHLMMQFPDRLERA
jgi:hypothetical protein